MLALNFPQCSIEWILARLPRLTASAAKANITATGKLSESQAAMKSIDKMIAGLIFAQQVEADAELRTRLEGLDDWQLQNELAHYTGDKFKGNLHTLRGNEYEHEVMAELSERAGVQLSDVGMVLMGDDLSSKVSCSPDGAAFAGGQMIAGGEAKSPTLATYMGYIVEGGLPPEYASQVHFSMAVCDLEEWHFGAMFAGCPLHYQCVKRSKLTDAIAKSLVEFEQQYADRYDEVMNAMDKLRKPICTEVTSLF